MAASANIRADATAPAPIFNHTDGIRVWAIRQNVSDLSISPSVVNAVQFIKDSQPMEAGLPRSAPLSMPLYAFERDGELPWRQRYDPVATQGLAGYGNSRMAGDFLAACYRPGKSSVARAGQPRKQGFSRALARLVPAGNAAQYRSLVENFARRYDLSAELVMAIIHSESHFSPQLVSSKSAMGLMQLLPSTASDEVHRFLYGRRGNVSFEELSNPEINIRYGTAYLHILHNRYFSSVKDRQVREACVIASYNLGPNRFLRLYGANNQQAINNINSMTPMEFHADLPRRLPVAETRFYVEKVRRMKQHYTGLQ